MRTVPATPAETAFWQLVGTPAAGFAVGVIASVRAGAPWRGPWTAPQLAVMAASMQTATLRARRPRHGLPPGARWHPASPRGVCANRSTPLGRPARQAGSLTPGGGQCRGAQARRRGAPAVHLLAISV